MKQAESATSLFLKCLSPVRFLNVTLRCFSWVFFIPTVTSVFKSFPLLRCVSKSLFSSVLAQPSMLPVHGYVLSREQHSIFSCRQHGSTASSLIASYFSFFITWEYQRFHTCCEVLIFSLLYTCSSPCGGAKFKWLGNVNFLDFS